MRMCVKYLAGHIYISTIMLAVVGCMFAFVMEADGDDSHFPISVMKNRRDIAWIV